MKFKVGDRVIARNTQEYRGTVLHIGAGEIDIQCLDGFRMSFTANQCRRLVKKKTRRRVWVDLEQKISYVGIGGGPRDYYYPCYDEALKGKTEFIEVKKESKLKQVEE